MKYWQLVGRIVAPPKDAMFWLVARIHKTTRPRVAIVTNSQILLVQNWGDTRWTLPGGGVHYGEPVAEAAAREVREELGVEIDPGKLVYHDTLERHNYHAPLFFYSVDNTALVVRRHVWEINDVQWFEFDEIPEASQLARLVVGVLRNHRNLL